MKYPQRWLGHLFTIPFITIPVIPLVVLHLLGEIYHRISFPIYGLPYVKASHYIIIDRHKLHYLNWFQKIACVYCGYVNGFLQYAAAVAGETEKYWCSILHKKGFRPQHHKDFLPYDDEQSYKKFLEK